MPIFGSRKAAIALLLVVVAGGGYALVTLVPAVADGYRRALEVGPAWGYAYLATVGVSAGAAAALVGWGVWTVSSNSRRKALVRAAEARSPSQMSRGQQQAEIGSRLAEGRLVADDASLPADTRRSLREAVDALDQKRETKKLEVVAFGTISSGKSSLLNALAGREAFRTDAKGGTTVIKSEVPWTGGDHVVLVDTPGLAEVHGQSREELAKSAARDADLVLLVTDGPLRDFEYELLGHLGAMEKAVLVCLNKDDWFAAPDRQRLVDQLAEQVARWVPRENVVALRARPATRIRTRVLADGSHVDEPVESEPDISALAARMQQLIAADGRDLLLANLLLQSRGLARQARAQVQSVLDQRAGAIVDRAMWQAGAAAALSPLPVVDLAAGLSITSHMVLQLARVYRQSIDLETVSRLLSELGKQLVSIAGANVAGPVAASAIASMLKSVPGAGTLSGGILQGLVQVLVTRWIGRVFIAYFRNEMQVPDIDFASLARQQWAEVTNADELVSLVKAGLSRLRKG